LSIDGQLYLKDNTFTAGIGKPTFAEEEQFRPDHVLITGEQRRRADI
jgi:hypothetical protein